MRLSSTALACVLAGALTTPASQPAPAPRPPSALITAMRQELDRSMKTLAGQPQPAYFLSYAITEQRVASVSGTAGALVAVRRDAQRYLDVDLRVGSPKLDNTHATGDMMRAARMFGRFMTSEIPIEDDPYVIRRALWRQTDREYRSAVEQFLRVKAESQLRAAPSDSSPDFSPEPAVQHADPPVEIHFDSAQWTRRIREYTAPFAAYPDIYGATATLSAETRTRWYVNSDGSEVETAAAYYRLLITAYSRADDGMLLPRYESFVAATPEDLPSDSVVAAKVKRMIDDLHALRRAPVLGAATAPAMLSGRASGVFFHEVFGHRIEGHRQKDEDDAQTFTGKVGERLLPRGMSVYFDPTLRRLGSVDLAGSYSYDDEGVAARRVDVVRDGVFRGFLMSRSPVAGFPHSNGHGRGQPGFGVVARQSNLVVTAAAPVTRAELERRLIAEIKRQHKPFGLYFDDIEGGFTITNRYAPNAFQVIPVMVYRVYADGREELVRGVDFIGTPLTVFGKILAADDQLQVFNGVCGAESGAVPVSASSPDILISQVEVQRKEKGDEQAPILPAPTGARP